MNSKLNSAPARRNVRVAIAVAAALSAPAAFAADPVPVGADDQPLAEILVFGRGETRQVATVTALDIQQAPPGTSALLVIEKLPGVSFQSADSFGSYEWSTRISIRGFSQQQLGFTLDGVPLGDMSYGNHNGLHISRAISPENIGRVKLSQGAGTLETATASNLGGTLQFFSADPAHEFGVNVALTGGSYSNRRGFVRFESGDFGAGTRAYLAYANQQSDKWKGDGQQKQQQMNIKIVQPVGEAKLTGFFNWSNRQENDYQDLSLDMINRLGYDWDNISNNWPLMVQVAEIYDNKVAAAHLPLPLPLPYPTAGLVFPAPIGTVDDAYANASGLRKDKLAGLTLNVPVSAEITWDTTAYFHKNSGQGVWFTPYVPTVAGAPDGFGGTITAPAPISVRTTEYDINRKGFTTALTWTLGQHAVNGGLWYEKNDFNQARRFYGLALAAPQRNSLDFMKDPFFTQWQYAFSTNTTQFFLQDSWAVSDALKVNFGFKSLDVRNKARAIVDTRFATSLAGDIQAKHRRSSPSARPSSSPTAPTAPSSAPAAARCARMTRRTGPNCGACATAKVTRSSRGRSSGTGCSSSAPATTGRSSMPSAPAARRAATSPTRTSRGRSPRARPTRPRFCSWATSSTSCPTPASPPVWTRAPARSIGASASAGTSPPRPSMRTASSGSRTRKASAMW